MNLLQHGTHLSVDPVLEVTAPLVLFLHELFLMVQLREHPCKKKNNALKFFLIKVTLFLCENKFILLTSLKMQTGYSK